ncbi:hypothetical protein [Geminocystis herdmanii]|uniref:hypothetical protein n=1 Tax=Geminocystis herdmanii TaxID=669359 RepID=UPI00034DD29D|nr:hypothetical protein [Geminocystis herdmanii]
MILTLNKNNYLQLLTDIKIIPKIIDNEEEYQEYLTVAEKLIAKKQNKTLEESVLLKLLVKLIEDYGKKNYEISEWANVSSLEILEHLIESKRLSTEELLKIMGSEKIVNDIRIGRENISKIQAQILGNYFQISPNLFLDI